MKRLFTLFILFACAIKLAAQDYTISGTISNAESKNIQLIESNGSQFVIDGKSDKIISTCIVRNGQFKFSGKLKEIMNVAIKVKNGRQFGFILQSGNTQIETDANKIWTTKIKNSIENELKQELYKYSRPSEADSQNVYVDRYNFNVSKKNREAAKSDSIKYFYFKRVSDSITKLRTIEFIKSHPKNFVSLNALNLYAAEFELVETKSLFKILETSFSNHTMYKQIEKKINQLENTVVVGSRFPFFGIVDRFNNLVNVNDIEATFLLIDFWASWCVPCRAENKTYQRIFNEFVGKEFKLVSISLDDSRQKWEKAIKDDKMNWINLSDLKGMESEVALRLGINAIPATYLLDKNRNVIAINLRGEDLYKKVKSLLAK